MFIHETGDIINDGAPNYISIAKILGEKLNFPNMEPYFAHTVTKERIHILNDPCHMLKLCRNTLGDYKEIFFHNESIQWQYFKELVKLQEETGLHAGTKIRRRHISYFKEKMKVNLAAQTFSCSVADAFQYCSELLKMEEFLHCGQTIKFCYTINDIFDFLNTRNFLNKLEQQSNFGPLIVGTSSKRR